MPGLGKPIESQMKPNDHGFTLIEIVIVMVLISIIAATVFTRSITTDELNLLSRAEKIQSHIRYAQSLAMKGNEIWGIECNKIQYWLFKGYLASDVNTAVKLPGEDSDKINLGSSGLIITSAFRVYFDAFGRPYRVYNPNNNLYLTVADFPLTITIESADDTSIRRKFSVTPETGLIDVIQ